MQRLLKQSIETRMDECYALLGQVLTHKLYMHTARYTNYAFNSSQQGKARQTFGNFLSNFIQIEPKFSISSQNLRIKLLGNFYLSFKDETHES
jgi:hypothetical protein